MASAGYLIFHSSVLLASLVIIILSSNYFIDALTSYARKLGMSNTFIGMVVVAFATCAPDIATGVMGLLQGKPEIMSGVVVGSMMIDIAFLNGWLAILAGKIKLQTETIKGMEFAILGLTLLPFVLLLDGEVSRSEGTAMVLSYGVYILLMWNQESTRGTLKKRIPFRLIWKDIAVFLLALGAMILAARYAVFSSVFLSVALGIPVYVLSITVLAMAVGLPETITGTIAILKRKGSEIGFCQNIGSPLLEINLFMGLMAMINPITFGWESTIVGTLGLMISATYFIIILRKRVITRRQGFVFLGIYFSYITLELMRTMWWN